MSLGSASCEFQGSLDTLRGHPFARISLANEPETMSTISLVMRSARAASYPGYCDDIEFYQVGQIDIPSYSADGKYFCMGRLHEYSITQSLSGVQHTCILELK